MHTGRVIAEHKTNYRVLMEGNEYVATLRGAFIAEHAFPKVGDYVHCNVVADGQAVIETILPRKSVIARRSVHSDTSQILVANVDVVFVVMGLDGDYNLSRLERYLLLAKQSDLFAVVVLNKADSVTDVETYLEKTRAVAPTVPVHAVSALTGYHMEELLQYFADDATAVLLGSSGAGKSTITNWLLQEDTQAVRDVRLDDSHGRHTTTARQLFAVPTGGYLIDTPGMRELGVQNTTSDDEDAVFAAIAELATECRFSNCDHEKSKGCAVVAAVTNGTITDRQLKNYQKLQRERHYKESKYDDESSWHYKHKQKQLHKGYNKIQKQKDWERELH